MAKLLVQVSALLNEAPIFNYADYVLRNWQRKNPDSPITIDNLEPLITFSVTDSEPAFIVVHVAYEAIAGEAIRLSQQLQSAISDNHASDLVIQHLNAMTTVLTYLHKTSLHIRDIVSPEVFRDKIRLLLKGWKHVTPMTYEDANQLRG